MASPSGHAVEPLIRGWGWRALIAFGIAVGGFLVALVGVVVLLVLGMPTALGVAGGVLWVVCSVLAGWAVEVGRWRRGAIGHVQRVTVAFGLLGAAAVLVARAVRGVGLLLELPAYGTAPSAAAPSFGAAALGALALALLLAAAPLEGRSALLSRSRLRRVTAGAATAGGIAALGTVATAVGPTGCGAFDFQAERWRNELAGPGEGRLVRMGEAVRRCGVVEPGMTRSQVRALLGDPSSSWSGTLAWYLGDGGLMPQQRSLVVRFERRDGSHRVSDVTATVSD